MRVTGADKREGYRNPPPTDTPSGRTSKIFTMLTTSPDIWWSPTSLQFQEIHARGGTDWTTINLVDDDGLAGQGEITSTQLSGSVAAITARLANRLRGQRIASDDHAMQILGVAPEACEGDQKLATAVSAIRCAVADALSRRAQLPLAQYLRLTHDHEGDLPDRVQLYGNINRSLLPDDQGPVDRGPDDFAEMAMEAVNNGFTTIKCAPFDECRAPFDSTGLPHCAEAGLERVQTIREAVGPDITIFVDCHSRFDLESALALEPELRAAGGEWFEEPVDPVENSDDLRTIHEHAILPVAGGEHAYGVNLFKKLVEEDILDIVMPDVKFCGGPVEAYRIGTELEPAYPGSVSMHCPSGPLSLLASAHATIAFENVLPLEHAVYEVDWRHELLEPYERVENGHLIIPEGPGLGARVDPAAIAFRGKTWIE